MSDSKPNSEIESIREWVIDHKFGVIGCLWLSGVAGCIAYILSEIRRAMAASNESKQQKAMTYNVSKLGVKTYCLRNFNARVVHKQALTLATLGTAAVLGYYDHKSVKFISGLPIDLSYSHKD